VYKVLGFANKYFVDNGVVIIFHDDDPHVLKEIKSFLETNGYDMHSKWAIINILPWMNSEIKGKMVIPLFICVYITFHSKSHLGMTFIFPHLAYLTKLGDFSCLQDGWLLVSRKSPRNGEGWCFLGRG
jgi:hypothetical protein